MPRIHTTPDGVRYTIHHERASQPTAPEKSRSQAREVLSPKGGRTVVTILDEDGNALATGEAICHPSKDNFNYKLGHMIALGRARKTLSNVNQ